MHRKLLPIIALLGWFGTPSPLAAQSPALAAGTNDVGVRAGFDSLVVIAPGGGRYGKPGWYRVIAGNHYRDLWRTPIRVPLLDLDRFAGGLTPLEAHAGSQTKSLRFRGANGREYQFRSVDKDPTASLAPELQGSAYANALQDGVSASFPAAAVVASALLSATGVLHVEQTLAVMPDDPRLGEFREGFKGILGMIELRPDSAGEETGPFGRPLRVLSPTRAFELFDASPSDRVDARAFLRARLMDMFMGDRDRHRDQFRWAAFSGTRPILWQPISRDHDEAFVHLDGLVLDISRRYYPPLVEFQSDYPKHDRLNWHAREIDRRFLVGLGRASWDSVATALQRALTDGVIDRAVRQLPPEMYPVGSERLTGVLQRRRDGLVQEALSYYTHLAAEVEIHGTNAAEVAEITRVDDHSVDVVIRARGDRVPYLSRRFDDRETKEIRLALWGGDDQVVLRGTALPHITVRIIGGAGNDGFIDSTKTGGVKLYDDQGENSAAGSRHPAIDTKRHQEWIGSDTDRYPPREWGAWWRPLPWLEANSDLGAFIGAGFLRTRYGFRRSPYASNIRFRVGYATGAQAIRSDLDADFHPENTSRFMRLHVLASGIETLRYYGQGNNTDTTGGSNFHRVHQQVFAFEPALVFPIGQSLRVSAGIVTRWSRTGANAGRFIASLRDTLLGGKDFGQVGGRLSLELDTRDRIINPLHGLRLYLAGSVQPAVWDVPHTFGSGEAEATTFLAFPIPGLPTIALRAGGKRVWGQYPFNESAFIGGRATLPGFHTDRFAGDASVYGNAELRITAGRSHFALPALWGFFGNVGAGRVYVDGESPGGWHRGAGGGVWWAFLDRSNTASIGISFAREGTMLQAGVGFGF